MKKLQRLVKIFVIDIIEQKNFEMSEKLFNVLLMDMGITQIWKTLEQPEL